MDDRLPVAAATGGWFARRSLTPAQKELARRFDALPDIAKRMLIQQAIGFRLDYIPAQDIANAERDFGKTSSLTAGDEPEVADALADSTAPDEDLLPDTPRTVAIRVMKIVRGT